MKSDATSNALRIALLYAFLAGLWILLSDRLLVLVAPDPRLLTTLQSYKGWAFVLVTAALLYLILRSQFQQLATEIIERRQIEQALQESQAILQAALDQSQAGIAIADAPDGTLRYVNEAGLLILGGTRAELVVGVEAKQYVTSWQIRDLDGTPMKTEDVPLARAAMYGEVCTREFLVRRSDGQDRLVWANAAPITNHQGEVTAAIVVFLDITQQKLAEETVRQNEARYTLAQRIAGVGIWEWDIQNDNIYWSPEIIKIYGYESDEFGGSFAEVAGRVHPEDLVRWQESVQASLEGHQEHNIEFRIVRPDETIRWVRALGDAQFDDKGQAVRMLGVVLDITERKQAEEQLKERNQFIETILDNLPIGLAVNYIDEGTASYMNAEFEKIYGWPREELTDIENFFKCVYPDPEYRKKIQDQVTADIASGDPQQMSWEGVEITTQNGQRRIVSAKNIPLYNQNLMISTVQDITERKRAEEQLRRTAQRLSLATESAGIGIWERDLVTNHLIWDERMYKLYDIRPENFDGTYEAWQQCVHPEDRLAARKEGEAAIAGDRLFHTQFRVVWPDGQIRHIEAHAVVQRAAGGQPQRMIGVNWDITRQKELAAANEQLTEQFYQAQKMDSIGQLAGGIAHDFNNLLVPIIGYAELGMMEVTQPGKLYTHLKQIKEAGDRASELTRQILAFSRQQVLEMAAVDLNQVVKEFQKMLQRLIGENIVLLTHLDPDLPPFMADKGQLEQVILNLVVNARDAMPEGGILTVETAQVVLDEAYAAKHAGVEPGPHALLAVSDTGYGMDAATRQRIFEPFFTTKERGRGTGLGLATVFGIAKQHGGNIWVYSEPGQGTTFKIYLPLTDSPAPSARSRESQGKLQRGTETVLVVEDEVGVRQLVTVTLQAHGYQVLAAGGGDEALALVKAHPDSIHLLLTDVVMAGMNGRELYEQLVQFRPDLRVLYMSGYTDNVIVHHGVLDKGVTFLQKPFATRSLLQKVRAALR